MKFQEAVKWVNRHCTAVALATLLFVLCGFDHFLALVKMDAVSRRFPIMNSQTERSMAAIDFLHGHRWFAGVFMLVFIGSLLYLELRNAPRWSVWLVFLFLAAPCVAYLMICAYINNKFIFLTPMLPTLGRST